jgi:hypothetical protein
MTLHLCEEDRVGNRLKINGSEIRTLLEKQKRDCDDQRIVYDRLENGRNYMSLRIFYNSHDDAAEVRKKLNGHEFFSNVHDKHVVLTVDFLRKK